MSNRFGDEFDSEDNDEDDSVFSLVSSDSIDSDDDDSDNEEEEYYPHSKVRFSTTTSSAMASHYRPPKSEWWSRQDRQTFVANCHNVLDYDVPPPLPPTTSMFGIKSIKHLHHHLILVLPWTTWRG
jgi:hypothetical protein